MPFYNEEDNIKRVEKEVSEALDSIEFLEDYEVVCINDGSDDSTLEKLKKIQNPKFRIYNHKNNAGLTAAIQSGIHLARFEIVGYIDSDLQTDPKEFKELLQGIRDGYDHVSGLRGKQKVDFMRTLSSKIGHGVTRLYLRTKLHDTNCPLQVFRKECLSNVTFYKNFHRFLSYLSEMQGYKVKEIPITHRARLAGNSFVSSNPWRRSVEGARLLYVIRWMNKHQLHF